jgi:hypothetical protein
VLHFFIYKKLNFFSPHRNNVTQQKNCGFTMSFLLERLFHKKICGPTEKTVGWLFQEKKRGSFLPQKHLWAPQKVHGAVFSANLLNVWGLWHINSPSTLILGSSNFEILLCTSHFDSSLECDTLKCLTEFRCVH